MIVNTNIVMSTGILLTNLFEFKESENQLNFLKSSPNQYNNKNAIGKNRNHQDNILYFKRIYKIKNQKLNLKHHFKKNNFKPSLLNVPNLISDQTKIKDIVIRKERK